MWLTSLRYCDLFAILIFFLASNTKRTQRECGEQPWQGIVIKLVGNKWYTHKKKNIQKKTTTTKPKILAQQYVTSPQLTPPWSTARNRNSNVRQCSGSEPEADRVSKGDNYYLILEHTRPTESWGIQRSKVGRRPDRGTQVQRRNNMKSQRSTKQHGQISSRTREHIGRIVGIVQMTSTVTHVTEKSSLHVL